MANEPAGARASPVGLPTGVDDRWLFERNPAPMLVYDRVTLEMLRANEAFHALYGWTEAELKGLTLLDLYSADEREAVRSRVPTLRGLTNVGEWRHVRRDGSLVHVVAQSHDTVHDGRPARVVAITDVSELRRSRDRDRQRLAVLERLARGDPLPSVLAQLAHDHEALFPGSLCTVLLVEAGTQRLRHGAGPSVPDHYRRAMDELDLGPGHGGCRAGCHAAQRVVVADLGSDPDPAPCCRLSMAEGLRSCWSEPITGTGGRMLGSFVVYRREPVEPTAAEVGHMQFSVQLAATVIERSGTEQALRESEARLSAILQAMHEMVWLKDTDGVYRMCNAAFAELAGMGADRVIGRTDADITEPDRAERYRAQDRAVLAGGHAVTEERSMTLRANGRPVRVVLTKTPMYDAEGRATGVLGVARDVTEERRVQARAQRLNRSYALLGSVNEAVLQLRDPQMLMAAVCRIAVVAGGFRLAWCGEARGTPGWVHPVARHGEGGAFLEALRIPLAEDETAPVARAWRDARPVIVSDVGAEPALAQRRDELRGLGQRALMVLPIALVGAPWRCLVVYSDSREHFDDEQLALLSRLARDIEHALHFIESERVQDEAQRFREQLIESVAGLFFAIDAKGRVVLWNRRFQELSGRDPAALVTSTPADYFDAADRARIADGIRRVFAEGETRVEATMITGTGERIPHVFVGRRLDTANGPLLVGTGIDISERVRSQDELARYRDGLERLVRQRTAELEAANARLQRDDRRLSVMLGLSQRASTLDEDEILRQGLALIVELTSSRIGSVLEPDPAGQPRPLRAWTGGGDVPPAPFAHAVARQGRSILADPDTLRALGCDWTGVVQALGAPVIEGERVALVVCVADKPAAYDELDQREVELLAADLWQVVQRRRTELELGRAKAAADAASQAKSAFLANMSHEIRTPMNAIVGFSHLLARDPLTQRQRDHLSKITDASQHLLQVINDILDFSKIEAHKITLEDADFDLRESLVRAQSMQVDAARVRRLPIAIEVDPAVPAVLRGDRLRLEQVLLNLLSNAVKFTAAGQVTLRAATVPGDDGRPLLRLEVSDTGIGMTGEQLSNVFEAFTQADVSTTRRFGGTGLGLAISRRLVQLMGGRMGADSQPGRGSTFWVELPLREGQARPAVAAPAAPPGLAGASRLAGAHILVAEDNPVNQEVATTLLTALGARVQLAGSGEEALRLFDTVGADLILMDVQMPGIDGLRATAEIRNRPGGAQVPIIAMTANAFAEDRAQCLAAGMNDYLAKPVEPLALEHCLLRWLPQPPAPPSPPPPPVADAEAQLRARLERIDGLDTLGPLARMRGAWGLYVRMLRMFVGHHADDAGRLEALADDDIAGLRALVHSISGAAATVGAVDIVRQAQALQGVVAAAPGGPVGLDARRPLAEALRIGVEQVRQALEPPAPAPAQALPAAADAAALRLLLDELAPLLAAHDTSALGLFERERPRLERAWGEAALELGRQLRQFDFGAAQQALSALRQARLKPGADD